MILKASQRGGGQDLAAYLLHYSQNEHIELLGLRGFAAEGDLCAALAEIEAQARGTRSTKPFFSVSFNPPPDMDASLETFEESIKKVEERFGLQHQPRSMVLHIKHGRRHVHVAWGLIDQEKNRAIKLGRYKDRLMDLSREIYRENGWEIPRGIQQDRKEARKRGQKIERGQPDNYTLAEKHQAERAGRDVKQFKQMVKDLYERADTRATFEASLAEKGLFLARGRRAFLIVDSTGDHHNLTKIAGRDQKELKQRLGDPATLPALEQVQQVIKDRAIDARFKRALSELRNKQARERNLYKTQLSDMQAQHVNQYRTLQRLQGRRMVAEEREWARRLNSGFTRTFDKITGWFTGEKDRTQKFIGREREESRRRDLREKDALHREQRLQRDKLKWGLIELERNQQKAIDNLREAIIQDIEREGGLREQFRGVDRDRSEEREHETGRDTDSGRDTGRDAPDRADDRGPKLER